MEIDLLSKAWMDISKLFIRTNLPLEAIQMYAAVQCSELLKGIWMVKAM